MNKDDCCKDLDNRTDRTKFTDTRGPNGEHGCEVTVFRCKVCDSVYVESVEYFPLTNLDIAYE